MAVMTGRKTGTDYNLTNCSIDDIKKELEIALM